MPSGNSFLFASIIGYCVLLASQYYGISTFLVIIHRIDSKKIFGSKFLFQHKILTILFVIVLLICQIPLFYWLFFYKVYPLSISYDVWNALWSISLIQCFTCVALSVLTVSNKYLAKYLHKRSHRIDKKQLINIHSQTTAYNTMKTSDPIEDSKQITRRSILFGTSSFVLGTTSTIMLQQSQIPMDDVRIETITLQHNSIPIGFDGVTLAILSDIHSSVYMTQQHIEILAAKVQKLNADIILLPGDFINSDRNEVFPCADALQSLSARLGVFAVSGNHDYYGDSLDTVVKELEQTNIRFLFDRKQTIVNNGDVMNIIGIDDMTDGAIRRLCNDQAMSFSHDISQLTMQNVVNSITDERFLRVKTLFDVSHFSLVINHRPLLFDVYSYLGADVMISGHTHGGQISLGEIHGKHLSLTGLTQRYVRGHYNSIMNHQSQLYVSRGVGSVGIPFRVFSPPEITFVTLARTTTSA